MNCQEELKQYVLHLFRLMLNIWGKTFDIQYGNVDKVQMLETWCAGLSDLSPTELMNGVSTLKDFASRYPPSLTEFRHICCPAINAEAAYHEAVIAISKKTYANYPEPYQWSNTAIAWAAYRMYSELLKTSYGMIKGRWEVCLKQEQQKHHNELPPFNNRHAPQLALPNLNRAKGKQRISELRNLLNIRVCVSEKAA